VSVEQRRSRSSRRAGQHASRDGLVGQE